VREDTVARGQGPGGARHRGGGGLAARAHAVEQGRPVALLRAFTGDGRVIEAAARGGTRANGWPRGPTSRRGCATARPRSRSPPPRARSPGPGTWPGSRSTAACGWTVSPWRPRTRRPCCRWRGCRCTMR
jgi:hypothetical protein